MLAGTLAGVEMGLNLANVPHSNGGVDAAMKFMMQPETAQPGGSELALASA